MTVKNQDGKEIFSRNKEYGVYDLHFAENKEGYLSLNNWDITAMTHVDLGLEPKKTDSQTFIIPLSKDTKSVDVEATFSYIYAEDGKKTPIHKINKKIEFTK
ncbi:MAG: hypothetical protein HZC11_03475 [Nitrospirae bacterium]|nr:hypothetical protein [Nitrospirota bacterium]